LGVLQLTIALSAWLATYCIGRLPGVMVLAIPALEFDFLRILLFDFGLVVLLMFLPTLAMGLTFPLVTHLYTDRLSSLGRRLGEAYAANTCGAILGSFLAGFVLVPTFGAQKALLGAVVLNLLVGMVLALADRASNAGAMGAVAATGLVLVALTPGWDPGQLSAGAGIYANAENFLFKPAYYKDGVSATVTVGFNGAHSPYLKVNGKTDASVAPADMCQQILNGLVPAALHPNPRQVAVIGLGSGVTAATLLSLDSVEKLRCAELEPAVVEVQSYFGPYNDHLLQNPRLDMQVNDGRTFIMGSPAKFDLIVSEPSNPWIAGIGNLYTEDFYRSCAERLNPGGMMCQWVNFYSVSMDDLEMVLSTFYSAYPYGAVFQVGPGDIMLVGKMDPLEIDAARLRGLWSQADTAGWLQLIGLLEPDFFFGTWVASREQVIATLPSWKDGKPTQPRNTDDRPLLEFQAPRSLYLKDPKVGEYLQSFPDAVPQKFANDPEAQMGALLGRLQLERRWKLEERVNQAVVKGWPLAPLADAILRQRQGQLEEAEGLLRAIEPGQASRPEAQIMLGDLRRTAQQWQVALMHYGLALENPLPGSVYTISMKAGECAARSGDLQTALQLFLSAAELTVRPDPLYKAGETKLGQGDLEGAADLFKKALERDPHDYVSLFRLAAIEVDQGKMEESYGHALASYRCFPELRENVELLLAHSARLGKAKDTARYQDEVNSLRQREAQLRGKAGR
jgi:spermidine synthase